MEAAVTSVSKSSRDVAALRDRLFFETLSESTGLNLADKESLALKMLMSDPLVKENLGRGFVSYHQRLADSIMQRRSHTISYRLSESEKSELKVLFPQFNIEFTDSKYHSHAFSAACRDMDERSILDRFPRGKPNSEYDFMVKDIGGNPGRHLLNGRLQVHSCFPCLSAADATRNTRFMLRLATYKPGSESRESNRLYNRFIRGEGACDKRAENCNVKAPFMVAIHSTYNISREHLADAMISANARELRGVFIFDTSTLVYKEGIIPNQRMRFRRYFSRGCEWIRFSFIDGGSLGYEHSYRDYLSLVRTIGFNHRHENFSLEIEDMRSGRCVFVMYRHYYPDIPMSLEFRDFSLKMEDKIVVYYWRSSIGGCDLYSLIPGLRSNNMQRVRIVVSRRLFERLFAYTLTLSEGKFVPQSVIIAANAYNQRITVNGLVVSERTDQLSSDDLLTLSYAVYLLAYVRKYDETQTLSVIKNEIDKRRQRQSFYSAIWDLMLTPFSRLRTFASFDGESVETLSLKDGMEVAPMEVKRLDKTEFSIAVQKLPDIFTVEEEINFVLGTSDDVYPLVEGDDTETPNVGNSVKRADHRCTGEFVPLTSPMDGNCFFHALRLVGATTLSPEDLRRKVIANSDKWLTPYSLRSSIVERLSCFSPNPPPEHWASEEVIAVTATVLGVKICLHTPTTTYLYGEKGEIYHLRLKDDHIDGLRVKITLPRCVMFELSEARFVPHEDVEVLKKNLFDGFSQRRCRAAINAVYPYVGLGNCGFVCRSGVKLSEIFYRLSIPTPRFALDLCSGPGGFSQFLTSLGTCVSYVNFEKRIPMEFRATSLLNLTPDNGDILDPAVSSHLMRHFSETSYDFVSGDGSPPGDSDGVVPVDDFIELLNAQVDLALAALDEGGNYVQKFMYLSDSRVHTMLHRISANFRTLLFIRPCSVRPASDEVYLVGLECRESQPLPLSQIVQACDVILADQAQALRRAIKFASSAAPIRSSVDPQVLSNLREALSYRCVAGGERSRTDLDDFYRVRLTPGSAVLLRGGAGLSSSGDLVMSVNVNKAVSTLVGSTLGVVKNLGNAVKPPAIPKLPKVALRLPTDKKFNYSTEWFKGRSSPPLRESVLPKVISLLPSLFPVRDDDSESVSSYHTAVSELPSEAVKFCGVKLHLPCVPEESAFDRLVRNVRDVAPRLATVESDDTTDVRVAEQQKYIDEFMQMTRHVIDTERSNLSSLYSYQDSVDSKSYAVMLSNIPGMDIGFARVVDGKLDYIVEPKNPLDYIFCFDGTDFVRVRDSDGKRVLVSELTEKFFESEFVQLYSNYRLRKAVNINLTQAAAGCGKTTSIVHRVKSTPGSVVLAGTIEGRDDLIQRISDDRVVVRTIQSYLLNPVPCASLFIDEAMMQHPGMITLASALSGASEVRAYGDRLQIPFVNRARLFRAVYTNLALLYPTTEHLMMSYRCPVSVAARLESLYEQETGYGMRSCNNVRDGESLVRITDLTQVPTVGFDIYLTFKQSEKQTLLQFGYKATTVHSFQGKEAGSVAVVRLSANIQDELYRRREYAVVALTRHRKRLTYYTACDDDILSRLILSKPTSEMMDRCYSPRAGGPSLFDMNIDDAYITYDAPDADILSVPVRKSPDTTVLPVLTTSVSQWKRKLQNLDDTRTYSLDFRVICDYKTFVGMARRFLRNVFLWSSLPGLAPSVVHGVMCASGLPLTVRPIVIDRRVDVLPQPDYPSIQLPISVDIIPQLQAIISSVMPNCVFVDQSMDTHMVHFEDIELHLRDVSFDLTRDVYSDSKYQSLRPRLSTPMPRRRPCTPRETLLAIQKRNCNVPDMAGVVDIPLLVFRMKSAISSVLRISRFETIEIAAGDIADWLHEQPLSVQDKLLEPLGTWEFEMRRYEFMIKRDVKPDLTVNSAYVYSALQTVLSHPKTVNAITCPMVRRIKDRVLQALPPNILFFTDASPEEFCEALDRAFPSYLWSPMLDSLEVDISKYDKSQGLLALIFECEMFRFFGAPEWFITLWFRGHIATSFIDFTTGVRGRIAFQRKSGDASTYLGNTLFLLGVLLTSFDYNNMAFLLCSGDDSLIVGKEFNKGVDVLDFSLLFNLEVKFLTYQSLYFCSKYLIAGSDRWALVPDPVKVIMKLGRKDLVNWEHAELYRVSYFDLVQGYKDFSLYSQLSAGVRERYVLLDYDISSLLPALYFVGLPENFSSLFYTLPGDVLCSDISFPTLDN